MKNCLIPHLFGLKNINTFQKVFSEVKVMAKGGSNEREVSKFLTKWLTGIEKPYMFWRQDASGGLATVHIENEHMTGDIKHLHPDSKFFTDIFSIECKTGYPKTSFWQHFIDTKFGIEEFWEQAVNDSVKGSKNPMLIYRKKHRRRIVGINRFIRECLIDRIRGLNYIMIGWNNSFQDCYLYDFEWFFEKVSPDDIKNIRGWI